MTAPPSLAALPVDILLVIRTHIYTLRDHVHISQTSIKLRALYDEVFWKAACIVSGVGRPVQHRNMTWQAVAAAVVHDAVAVHAEVTDMDDHGPGISYFKANDATSLKATFEPFLQHDSRDTDDDLDPNEQQTCVNPHGFLAHPGKSPGQGFVYGMQAQRPVLSSPSLSFRLATNPSNHTVFASLPKVFDMPNRQYVVDNADGVTLHDIIAAYSLGSETLPHVFDVEESHAYVLRWGVTGYGPTTKFKLIWQIFDLRDTGDELEGDI